MPYSLKGRNVLVTGGSRGLGELICLKFADEGCNVAINYNSSADKAAAVAKKVEQDYGTRAFTIQGDMGLQKDCVHVVKESISKLGGLDIIISNAGYTRFSNFGDLNDSTVEDWDLCYAVNVKAHVFLMREALATFNANPEGGIFIITSSIAGRIPGGSSMPYSVTKAAQLHLMRCLASTQGPKIRVNAVLPGFLRTEWGERYGPDSIEDMRGKAYLRQDTDLDDAAQAFIDITKNTSMTGQRIQVDSGLGQND
ncbi:short-chain dehydrogenase/reductase-like protein sdr [Hyaloscypha sp. PMI_1271]|nr:short-chain dehydrogenase/reductase-like protein sdr [Hyaloscypha sp. PMI_1271]